MTKPTALGPASFAERIEDEADRLFREVIRHADGYTKNRLQIDGYVFEEVRPVLQKKLKEIGLVVAFSNWFMGGYFVVTGDFKGRTFNQPVESVIRNINDELNSQHLAKGSVSVYIYVPENYQADVRKVYLEAGWKSVEFVGDNPHNSFINFLA